MHIMKIAPLFLLVLISACKIEDSLPQTTYTPPQIRSVAELCQIAGGEYNMALTDCDASRICQNADRQSCIYQFQQDCKDVGAVFNACASACRNLPNARACTKQCVPVCRG